MTTSSCRLSLIVFIGLLCLTTGCAATGRKREGQAPVRGVGIKKADSREGSPWTGQKVAVLPVYNVTAAPAPLEELETLFSDDLEAGGVTVLGKDVLHEFMAKRRMRYVGGLDGITAFAMKDEMDVDSVLVTTLEFFDDGDVPRISLHGRLVSSGDHPEILWMDSVCMAGDDAPGFLSLGVINDSRQLMETAVERLVRSLTNHLAGVTIKEGGKSPGKGVRPTFAYRSPGLKMGDGTTVAVMPFLNLSERPFAWEIVPLHFVRHLVDTPGLRVLEPGEVRRQLLDSRVLLEGGLSRPNLELVVRSTGADLVLTGSVMRYLDTAAPSADPEVEFSVEMFDGASEEVIWSSRSVGTGSDGVFFFGLGRKSTACRIASELARGTVREMIGKINSPMKSADMEGTAP